LYARQFPVKEAKRRNSIKKLSIQQERVLPAGVHEVPFSYTLPKSLPTSFEGEFGHIRYTCRAICERPWDFDIVTRKAFTVIGIEDINSDARVSLPG
ncbi:arrestin domain protein, partial [Ancylostoma duodenale]